MTTLDTVIAEAETLKAAGRLHDVEAVRHWLSVAEAVSQGHADALPCATMALNYIGRLQEARRHYNAAESALAHDRRSQRSPH